MSFKNNTKDIQASFCEGRLCGPSRFESEPRSNLSIIVTLKKLKNNSVLKISLSRLTCLNSKLNNSDVKTERYCTMTMRIFSPIHISAEINKSNLIDEEEKLINFNHSLVIDSFKEKEDNKIKSKS